MSFFEKLFPRKGEKESFKEEDEARQKAEAEKKREEERIAKEKQEEADYLSLKDFDFKHPIKSMRLHIRLVKEGIYKGDKRAWHQFLMVLMISLAGFCVLTTICVDFCFELISLRLQFSNEYAAKIIQQNKAAVLVQDTLPSGEYGMVHIFQSASFYEGNGEGRNVVVMVANRKGGAVMVSPLPEGVEIPEQWYGSDSYTLVVDDEGKWSFKQSEVFEEHKQAVENAQKQYMERMSGAKPQENQAPTPDGNP